MEVEKQRRKRSRATEKWIGRERNDLLMFYCKHIRSLADILMSVWSGDPPSSLLLQVLPALWSSCGLGLAGSSQSCALSSLSTTQPHYRNSVLDKTSHVITEFSFDLSKNTSLTHVDLSLFHINALCMCSMWIHERCNTGSGTHVCQTSDKDEGSRRVWPGQLEPDLAYLAEAQCHLHSWWAVSFLLQRFELPKHIFNAAVRCWEAIKARCALNV